MGGPKPQVRPLQSLVPVGPGPKSQVRPLQSLVPAGPRLKPQVRPLQSLVPAGSGSQPQSQPLKSLVPAGSGRSQKRSSWKYYRHTRQPLRGGYNALEYLSNSTRVVLRKEPCPSAGNTAASPPAKEPEKMQTLHQGVLVFIASTHLEQRRVKEAG
ncbi:hypothetical protein F2Q68_00005403 [Brassica cretica]|uniref:Uncharacterized protein n=1 Tax=Brassica cretica TaxID=69181 RepID=A0A8S9J4C8_BRACR|nr:hypothetical protein F2Q68_00005403 [Brassica cretica]